jgi:phospholipase/carboxylesterase
MPRSGKRTPRGVAVKDFGSPAHRCTALAGRNPRLDYERGMRTEIAGLSCVVFPEESSPDSGVSRSPPRAVVVLCHGFGAPGDDLVGLHAELLHAAPSLASARFIFPQAPLSLAAQGYADGRAWWFIDMAKLQHLAVQSADAVKEFRRVEPEGMPKARAMMLKLVDDVCAATGVGINKVILGGFSQGAMLATDVALRLPEAPRALVALSGTLLMEDVWAKKAKARAGLPVFQSHGEQDPVLAFSAATALKDTLVAGGLAVEFHRFRGGHGIPGEVLNALAAFLKKSVG